MLPIVERFVILSILGFRRAAIPGNLRRTEFTFGAANMPKKSNLRTRRAHARADMLRVRSLAVMLLLVLAGVACGGDDTSETNSGEDAGTDAGADAADAATDAGIDANLSDAETFDPPDLGPGGPTRCAPEDPPEIVGVTLTPDTFTTAEAGDTTTTLTVVVELYCFSRPIERVVVATESPRLQAPDTDFEAVGDTLVLEDVALADWLGGQPAGTYPVSVTVSSTDETLTVADLAAVTIEEP
jgi:hypothetical protein